MEDIPRGKKEGYRQGGYYERRKRKKPEPINTEDIVKEVDEGWRYFWTRPNRINLENNPLTNNKYNG